MADQTRIDAYYRELDPVERKKLLDEFEEDDPFLEERKLLFERRYRPVKDSPGQYADRFLYAFMQILQSRTESTGLFGMGQKRMRKVLNILRDPVQSPQEQEESHVLHREIVNAVRRYFETCMSPSYRRKLFGTMMPTDEERAAHIRQDAWDLSYGMAERLALREESAFLCRAVTEAYSLFAPEHPPLTDGPLMK